MPFIILLNIASKIATEYCNLYTIISIKQDFNFSIVLFIAFVVTASFDKVRAFNFEGRSRNVREQLMSEDVMDSSRLDFVGCPPF